MDSGATWLLCLPPDGQWLLCLSPSLTAVKMPAICCWSSHCWHECDLLLAW